jgi:hypothetical protein
MDTELLQLAARRLAGFLAAEASSRQARLGAPEQTEEKVPARLASTLCTALGPQARVCLDEGLLWQLKDGTQTPYEELLGRLPPVPEAELLLGHLARFNLRGEPGFAAVVGLRSHSVEVAAVALWLPGTGELSASADRGGRAFIDLPGGVQPYATHLRSGAAREPGAFAALDERMAALGLARVLLLHEERTHCLLGPGPFAASTYAASVFAEGLGLQLSRLDGSPLRLDPGATWPPTLCRLSLPSGASRTPSPEPVQAWRSM